MGKTTIRTIQTFTTTVPKGAKPEKELLAGFKCKFDNKKPICGLAAHPIDPNTVILLVVDGTVVVATVGGGIVTPLCSILVPFDAKKERVQMQALPIAGRPGAAMVLVEAEKSGLTVVELPSRLVFILILCWFGLSVWAVGGVCMCVSAFEVVLIAS